MSKLETKPEVMRRRDLALAKIQAALKLYHLVVGECRCPKCGETLADPVREDADA